MIPDLTDYTGLPNDAAKITLKVAGHWRRGMMLVGHAVPKQTRKNCKKCGRFFKFKLGMDGVPYVAGMEDFCSLLCWTYQGFTKDDRQALEDSVIRYGYALAQGEGLHDG